jgi:hypothetical protein
VVGGLQLLFLVLLLLVVSRSDVGPVVDVSLPPLPFQVVLNPGHALYAMVNKVRASWGSSAVLCACTTACVAHLLLCAHPLHALCVLNQCLAGPFPPSPAAFLCFCVVVARYSPPLPTVPPQDQEH